MPQCSEAIAADLEHVSEVEQFAWNNALDERGVVHRVVSLLNVMNHCAARCGLDGRWDHKGGTMAWTAETLSCMTCTVRESEYATT